MEQHDKQCHHEVASDAPCHADAGKPDHLLRFSMGGVGLFYIAWLLWLGDSEPWWWLASMAQSVYELVNTMWLGIALGVVMIGLLSKIPRAFVISLLGSGRGMGGIVRATCAGVLLDLCSHGILMVGAKLYERGASTAQVMAFLIASPWNSFSFTLVLIALVGLPWTITFIALSALIALMTGLIFNRLERLALIPANPNRLDLPQGFDFWSEVRAGIRRTRFDRRWFYDVVRSALSESKMVVRWILFGILLASVLRSLMSAEQMQTYFGPTLAGLGLTLLGATLLEICSEGSSPIAADLLTKAGAPGNSFTFLMAGVATDYTELMVLRDTTRSWLIALLLPLITVPQILLLGWIMNDFFV